MPSKPDKSQDKQTDAGKSPLSGKKEQGVKAGAKSAEREARLAEALRANLRRRKQSAGDRKKKDDLDG